MKSSSVSNSPTKNVAFPRPTTHLPLRKRIFTKEFYTLNYTEFKEKISKKLRKRVHQIQCAIKRQIGPNSNYTSKVSKTVGFRFY